MRRGQLAVRWRDFAAGAAAGAAGTLAAFALRIVGGAPTPDEILAQWFVGRLPFPVFAWLLAALQHAAKPLAFALTVAATLMGCGLGGLAYGRGIRAPRHRSRFAQASAAAVGAAALGAVVVLSLRGVLSAAVVAPALPLAVGAALYGLLLARWIPGTAPARIPGTGTLSGEPVGAARVARRRLLRHSALLVTGLAAAVLIVRR
ncbi:MAG TPA: hypothetical protein VK587_07300, partial [bacterium]|nr:hypothetical protein [bacterium]